MQFNKKFQKPIPVREGETYEVTIENMGEKGDGIAKVDGYVIIVPKTQKGERVKVKVTAVRGKVSFGEVIEKLGEAPVEEEKETEDEEEGGEEEMDDDEEEGEEDADLEDEEMEEDQPEEEK